MIFPLYKVFYRCEWLGMYAFLPDLYLFVPWTKQMNSHVLKKTYMQANLPREIGRLREWHFEVSRISESGTWLIYCHWHVRIWLSPTNGVGLYQICSSERAFKHSRKPAFVLISTQKQIVYRSSAEETATLYTHVFCLLVFSSETNRYPFPVCRSTRKTLREVVSQYWVDHNKICDQNSLLPKPLTFNKGLHK